VGLFSMIRKWSDVLRHGVILHDCVHKNLVGGI
jgi:hypothetical protein